MQAAPAPFDERRSGVDKRRIGAGAGGGTRTRTIKDQGILSPWRLPFRHARICAERLGTDCVAMTRPCQRRRDCPFRACQIFRQSGRRGSRHGGRSGRSPFGGGDDPAGDHAAGPRHRRGAGQPGAAAQPDRRVSRPRPCAGEPWHGSRLSRAGGRGDGGSRRHVPAVQSRPAFLARADSRRSGQYLRLWRLADAGCGRGLCRAAVAAGPAGDVRGDCRIRAGAFLHRRRYRADPRARAGGLPGSAAPRNRS